MKILLCDNDISTIDLLEKNIDWRSLGIFRILQAYDSHSAKQIIAKERPDLVLSEIEIPLCSGIEVLKYIRENQFRVQFAFITGCRNFEYVRDALRYGAVDYILKPVDLDEVTEALIKMTNAANRQNCFGYTDQSSTILINNALRCIWEGSYGEERDKIKAALKRDAIDLDVDSLWRVLSIQADTAEAQKLGWSRDLLRYGINFLAQESITGRTNFSYMLSNSHEQTDFIVLFVEDGKISESELVERSRMYIRLCNEHFSVNPLCIISDPVPLFRMHSLFREMGRKSYECRMRKDRVLLCREIDSTSVDSNIYYDPAIFADYIARQKRAEFMEYLRAVIQNIINNSKNISLQIFLLHDELLKLFLEYVEYSGLLPDTLMTDAQFQAANTNALRSENDMLRFAEVAFDRVAELTSDLLYTSNVTRSVKYYIQRHYSENITRDQLAEYVHVSPNYLSKRFRIDSGINISQYINQVRIEAAKKLLISTDLTIDAVSASVGFSSSSYFSSVFRKMCGASPVSWRENMRKRISGKEMCVSSQ